jgi:hypothetical protein
MIMKKINELGYDLIEIGDNTILVGRELIGVNSKTIVNYCPNSNQIFIGYFESKDDLLYGRTSHHHPREIIASKNPIKGVPLLEITNSIDIVADKFSHEKFPDRTTPGWVDGFSALERKGYIEGYKDRIKSHPFSYDDVSFILGVALVVAQINDLTFEEKKKKLLDSLEKKPHMDVEYNTKATEGIEGYELFIPKIEENKIKIYYI